MTKLSEATEIITLSPSEDNLTAGANYAAITLPWTFNRMMLNTGVKGQKQRALNIAKGIVAQAMLRKWFSDHGVIANDEKKSHRDDDLFDFNIEANGKNVMLDVKSIHYYTDYKVEGRDPFTTDLVIANANYPGPDWRNFFPMIVPHTQIRQDKEAYCFAITASHDFRNVNRGSSVFDYLTTFPYGEQMAFMCNKKLIIAREEKGKGFFIELRYDAEDIVSPDTINLIATGEWDSTVVMHELALKKGKASRKIGPFSCFSNVRIERESLEAFSGTITLNCRSNELGTPILNSSRRNINTKPTEPLVWDRESFCNLCLPDDFEMHVVGWIDKEDFLNACRQYDAWVWPDDSTNRFHNQPWTQITEKDERSIKVAGFIDSVTSHDNPPVIELVI